MPSGVRNSCETIETKLLLSRPNSFSRSSLPFMRSYDWACDGGITRNVYMVMTGREAVRNIHVTAVPNENGGSANIRIEFVDPSAISDTGLRIDAIITEENQPTSRVVFNDELHGSIVNGSFVADVSLGNIKLWHFDSPNLYRLSVKLIAG